VGLTLSIEMRKVANRHKNYPIPKDEAVRGTLIYFTFVIPNGVRNLLNKQFRFLASLEMTINQSLLR
jgi:hypothetical protein